MWESMLDAIKEVLTAIISIDSISIIVERIESGCDDTESCYVDYPVVFTDPVTGIKHEVIIRKKMPRGWEIKVKDKFMELGPGTLYKELYYQVAERRLP